MDTLKNDTLIAGHLSKLVLGEAQQFKNMTVIPLFTSVNHSPEYLTLKEALEKSLLTVTEASLGGSVPQLKVINLAELPVLLVDGEELAGAKQNRVLNASILLKARSETLIPVSCSEQGRWSYRTSHFSHSGHVMSHKLRAAKSSTVAAKLKMEAEAQQHSSSAGLHATHHSYASDQHAVWDGVHEMMLYAKVKSPSHAMHDIYTAKTEQLEDYVKAIQPAPEQKGLLVFINGAVAGLDLVSLDRAYRVLHPTLLRSYAMEALLQPAEQTVERVAEKAGVFFEETAKCSERKYPSVGDGMDYRFEGSKIAGAALVADEKVIHLALYRC